MYDLVENPRSLLPGVLAVGTPLDMLDKNEETADMVASEIYLISCRVNDDSSNAKRLATWQSRTSKKGSLKETHPPDYTQGNILDADSLMRHSPSLS